jgi:hypothetical protein
LGKTEEKQRKIKNPTNPINNFYTNDMTLLNYQKTTPKQIKETVKYLKFTYVLKVQDILQNYLNNPN